MTISTITATTSIVHDHYRNQTNCGCSSVACICEYYLTKASKEYYNFRQIIPSGDLSGIRQGTAETILGANFIPICPPLIPERATGVGLSGSVRATAFWQEAK